MRLFYIVLLIISIACQAKENNLDAKLSDSPKVKAQTSLNIASQDKLLDDCSEEICLQLINYDKKKSTFDIWMSNSVPVAGFQCDFHNIKINEALGGLLEDNGFDASNSDHRVLAFSMQAKTIPAGSGILTTISFSDSQNSICMTDIIFAGIGGVKKTTNIPDCINIE